MSDFRVVYEYNESNGSGFNEVLYVTSPTAAAAAIAFLPYIQARLAMLHPLNTLLRIRSSQVDQLRVTATTPLNLPGTYSGTSGPVPVGAAAVLQLASAAGGQRKLWLRGIPDSYYYRNATTGRDTLTPDFNKALINFFGQLESAGYGLRKLTPAGAGLLANRRILSVDGTAKNGTSICTLDLAPGYPVPSRVVIGGASKKDLPGLNGHFTVITVNGALITINYQTPLGNVVTSTTAKMRQEQYAGVNEFNANQCAFDHFGTRTSRNPLSRSRGARRAVRLRNSL